MGLYSSHAYSVTWVRPVEAHFKANEEPTKVPLLRIRNPWGYGEWLGLWSDESSVWKYVSKEEKEAIGYKFEADGEFWMDIEDLKKNFNEVGICHLSLDSLSQAEIGNREKCWKMAVFEGEWVRGVTSGGCRRHLDTFPNNPQYRIWFKTADEEDKEKKCTVIIQLMQKHRRRQFYKNLTYVFMGFQLYYLQHPDRLPKPLDKRFFQRNNYIGSSTYQNGRSVTARFKLTPGCYCIVPTTINVTDEAEFLIRVFSEHKSHLEEYDVDLNLNVSDNDEVNVLRPMVPVTYKLKQNEQEKNGNENKVENDVAEQSRKLFIQLAGDDMQIDWVQLKPILDQALKNELRGEGVSKEICRTMVAMVDKDCTGKIGYDEFKSLWINICSWKAVFNKYKDGSGSVTTSNLREALVSAGYILNRHTLNLLVHRYGNADKNIDLDDFISCVIRLETMINSFKEIARFEKAAFTLDKWLLTTLYS